MRQKALSSRIQRIRKRNAYRKLVAPLKHSASDRGGHNYAIDD